MNYFENLGYTNKRNRKRTLILDVEDSNSTVKHLGTGGAFNIKLYEPMIIDKHSEVYLDNFLTFNSSITSSSSTSAFVLKINEFNMNSNVASTHGAGQAQIGVGDDEEPVYDLNAPGGQHLFNSLIIPNEHKNPSNNHTAVVHKGKKFNYVCDMNPQTISSLSGSITDLEGKPIFHGGTATGVYTYALTGINQTMTIESVGVTPITFPLRITDTIRGISSMAGVKIGENDDLDSATITGSILVSTHNNANTLHFALDQELTVGATGLTSNSIEIEIARHGCDDSKIVLNHAPVTNNPNLQLIKGDGRFIAEFSIISRE